MKMMPAFKGSPGFELSETPKSFILLLGWYPRGGGSHCPGKSSGFQVQGLASSFVGVLNFSLPPIGGFYRDCSGNGHIPCISGVVRRSTAR